MNALIIAAAALIAAGLLISVILWFRNPGAGNSEYVTVAELQARLEDEYEHPEQAARRPGTADEEVAEQVPDTAEPAANEPAPHPTPPAGNPPVTKAETEHPGIEDETEAAGDTAATAAEPEPGPRRPVTRKPGDTPTAGSPDRNH